MVNRRELILLGALLCTISLAFAQARAADVPPTNLPIATPAAPAVAPAPGDTPAEDPAAKLQDLAVLFNGESTLSPQVEMGGWGYIRQDTKFNPFQPKRLYASIHSPYYLYITTLGRYQGVRFDFAQPLPAAELLGAKNVFLELYVRAYTETETTPVGLEGVENWTPWTTPPTSLEVSEGKLPESAYPKEMRTPPLTVPLPQVPDLRFTFFTDKGALVIVEPLAKFFPKEEINRQWIRICIPLSTLDPAFKVGTKLTRLVITSDKPAAFYIGRMAFVKDEIPITIDPLIYPAYIEMGKRIFFSSRAEFGLTQVETTWTFDNGNGAPIDVKGDRTTFTFDKEGRYTVTCTVHDPSGGKAPVKQVIEVKVSAPAKAGGQGK